MAILICWRWWIFHCGRSWMPLRDNPSEKTMNFAVGFCIRINASFEWKKNPDNILKLIHKIEICYRRNIVSVILSFYCTECSLYIVILDSQVNICSTTHSGRASNGRGRRWGATVGIGSSAAIYFLGLATSFWYIFMAWALSHGLTNSDLTLNGKHSLFCGLASCSFIFSVASTALAIADGYRTSVRNLALALWGAAAWALTEASDSASSGDRWWAAWR